MAAPIPLMPYLQVGMPHIPARAPRPAGKNTTNDSYSHRDIREIREWGDFNLQQIQQDYGALLAAAMISPDPLPTSPPQAIRLETGFKTKAGEILFPQVRRALRQAFAWLANQPSQPNQPPPMTGKSVVSMGVGELARTPGSFLPDVAFFEVGLAPGVPPNRVPGDLKPHWKWDTNMADSVSDRSEYLQALSQVNFYMHQHNTRYGFLLTNHEMVAIRRRDDRGSLELSRPIPWEAAGTPNNQRMTVLLALWYLGMLASQNEGDEHTVHFVNNQS
ncbi:hypothetical protein BJX66DRAFT_325261 [Aspergillus keveii]|uniref:Phosphotransferase enzyme family protein n=1 Tax=Aspergillus keveii TaxID=714993 RepID=A0ABR4G6I4_9EURO